MKISNLARTALAIRSITLPKDLDINATDSIKDVASTVAYGTMSYYSGNVTNTNETIAVFPRPYYWWEAGAAWGAMLDYYHYTGDDSYLWTTQQALLSQVGPNYDYMNPVHFDSTGNDDQAFWCFSVLTAAEHNIPLPDRSSNMPSWLNLAENLWNSMVVRWNVTSCGGGFTWQIFASNPNGLNYKNSVANGAFFQISARLARATGNSTYLDWAQRVWDWSAAVGFVDTNLWLVYDGADSSKNCTDINEITFTYTHGIYMYGAAVLANLTGDAAWQERVNAMMDSAERRFFTPYDNSTNIMYEQACETVGTCNVDMKSFKGYLSRFLWYSTKMVPTLTARVETLLGTSALAAAKACSGGENGTVCGQKWYVGGYDGSTGLGQQLCALETIQGLLAKDVDAPLKAGEIEDVRTDPPSNN